MNTTPTANKSDDETSTARFMNLLHHPEEHDGDGEHLGRKRIRALDELPPPPTVIAEEAEATTTRLPRPGTAAQSPKE